MCTSQNSGFRKILNRPLRKASELNICLRPLTSLTSFWCFFVNFEHISHLFSSVSIVDFEQVNVSLVIAMFFGSVTYRSILRYVSVSKFFCYF